MRKKILPESIAIITVISLIAASPMTAFADTYVGDQTDVAIRGGGDTTKEITIEGNVQNENTYYAIDMRDSSTEKLNANLTVNGDATAKKPIHLPPDDQCAVFIYSQSQAGEAAVHVTDDVLIDTSAGDGGGVNNGVRIVNTKSKVTVDQNVKVSSDYNRAVGIDITANEKQIEISVGKSIEAFSASENAAGISMYVDSASIEVGEDINVSVANHNNSSYNNTARGIVIGQGGTDYVDKDIDIRVKGNIEAKQLTESIVVVNTTDGILVVNNDRNLNIIVEGDVIGTTHGVNVWDNYGIAEIVVGGTLSNLSERSAAINVVKQEANQNAPNITVWKVESGSDKLVSSREWNAPLQDYVEDPDYADIVQKSINYIIKGNVTENGKDTSNGKIVLKGTSKVTIGTGDKAKTYETAHQDEEITINVETVKGYKYSLSDTQGLLTKKSDGSYTLKVPAGGGVDLRAVLERIESDRRSSDGGRSSDREEKTNNSITLSAVSLTDMAYDEQGWIRNGLGWRVKKPDGNYANNEWYYLSWNGEESWYHFDERGYLQSGWLTDADGQRYYLYNAHDGQYGRMLTGWNEINGRWYFFNTADTGTAPLGALFTNGTTPDGYTVDASGARVQ